MDPLHSETAAVHAPARARDPASPSDPRRGPDEPPLPAGWAASLSCAPRTYCDRGPLGRTVVFADAATRTGIVDLGPTFVIQPQRALNRTAVQTHRTLVPAIGQTTRRVNDRNPHLHFGRSPHRSERTARTNGRTQQPLTQHARRVPSHDVRSAVRIAILRRQRPDRLTRTNRLTAPAAHTGVGQLELGGCPRWTQGWWRTFGTNRRVHRTTKYRKQLATRQLVGHDLSRHQCIFLRRMQGHLARPHKRP